jgi:hypothetical protein
MPKIRLKIDMADLELAFGYSGGDFSQFLDLQTGEIVIAESYSEEADSYDVDERYVPIPRPDSQDDYAVMEQFVSTIRDAHLRELLEVAIQGKGAFRRFKDVLRAHPDTQEQWFAFKDQELRERINEWLNEQDIEPIS